MTAEIVSIAEVGQTCGGKAHGLARLVAMGLDVPAAFAIRDAQEGSYPDGLDSRLGSLKAPRVAVRSSATGEDGAEASFAGQFDSVLNVHGPQELRAAIDQCVASASATRVGSYLDAQAGLSGVQMHLVVQAMVDARAAGVVFTADPVSARRDVLVIDAVAGLGESLVSGEATPDHWEVGSDGSVIQADVTSAVPVLSADEVAAVATGARQAAEREGHPLDLEWAIDQDGRLWWLQARPITTLPARLDELDTALPRSGDVLTMSNIGEMMPGAVCPLTQSFTGWGIDYGLQHMQVAVGARGEIDRDIWQVTAASSGHLFLNLTGNVVLAAGILGSDADQTAQAICGRVVEELDDLPPLPLWRRVVNTGRLVRYSLAAPKAVAAFTEEVSQFELRVGPTAAATWREIAAKAPFFEHAMAVHIQSSALSGFYNAIVENLVSARRNNPTAEEQAESLRLIAGATDVLGAVMLAELDELAATTSQTTDVLKKFVDVPAQEALTWLRDDAAFGPDFDGFLARHGHRGIRELCVRDSAWGDDPLPLVRSLQSGVRARLGPTPVRKPAAPRVELDGLSRGLRSVLPRAHDAIRRREFSKDLLVQVAHRFQTAFRSLGGQLTDEGALTDGDLVYFFTFDELGEFVSAPSTRMAARAEQRRRALEFQGRLSFPEVCVGRPRPLTHGPIIDSDGQVHGRPASPGVIEGTVRVAMTLDEAADLQPGEILVTPITDIGWSPWFASIGGLITDLGSSVSHGAVVAREYGLPCVVNTRDGTRRLHTGDVVRLNGAAGTVEVLRKRP